MRASHAYFLFIGTLLTAAGYGATFLLTEHFRALGGSEIDTSTTSGGAMIGTLIGVPLVGWYAKRLKAARMAAMGAVSVAAGYGFLTLLTTLTPLIAVADFFIGLGWGIFYLAGPMALSERVSDQDRGFWFTRFGAFQMAGIGFSPIIASALVTHIDLTTAGAFGVIATATLLAALLLLTFEILSPQARQGQAQSGNWVQSLPALFASRARYPILMVGLGACVFSGMLTFQSSLVRGSGLEAGTYFAAYAVTVVVARFILAPIISRADGDRASIILLVLMSLGVAAAFALALGLPVQITSAVLLGLGYGLVYTVIQTQAVNDAPPEQRSAALTWFVIAYFLGIFGFPVLGGWMIVTVGIPGFLAVVLAFALAELALALLRARATERKPADALS
ncbi:MFS transporter [Taklimakanibacter lacteus]|uniref:MFS transporter n=1 Tax=Taklimakanibacter lacteus TaxID=2268456 RepID=UPI000E66BAFF